MWAAKRCIGAGGQARGAPGRERIRTRAADPPTARRALPERSDPHPAPARPAAYQLYLIWVEGLFARRACSLRREECRDGERVMWGGRERAPRWACIGSAPRGKSCLAFRSVGVSCCAVRQPALAELPAACSAMASSPSAVSSGGGIQLRTTVSSPRAMLKYSGLLGVCATTALRAARRGPAKGVTI